MWKTLCLTIAWLCLKYARDFDTLSTNLSSVKDGKACRNIKESIVDSVLVVIFIYYLLNSFFMSLIQSKTSASSEEKQ